jgi:hypothetical protein
MRRGHRVVGPQCADITERWTHSSADVTKNCIVQFGKVRPLWRWLGWGGWRQKRLLPAYPEPGLAALPGQATRSRWRTPSPKDRSTTAWLGNSGHTFSMLGNGGHTLSTLGTRTPRWAKVGTRSPRWAMVVARSPRWAAVVTSTRRRGRRTPPKVGRLQRGLVTGRHFRLLRLPAGQRVPRLLGSVRLGVFVGGGSCQLGEVVLGSVGWVASCRWWIGSWMK